MTDGVNAEPGQIGAKLLEVFGRHDVVITLITEIRTASHDGTDRIMFAIYSP
jgi:hypothetical protein